VRIGPFSATPQRVIALNPGKVTVETDLSIFVCTTNIQMFAGRKHSSEYRKQTPTPWRAVGCQPKQKKLAKNPGQKHTCGEGPSGGLQAATRHMK
jgi:hypothetical protein